MNSKTQHRQKAQTCSARPGREPAPRSHLSERAGQPSKQAGVQPGEVWTDPWGWSAGSLRGEVREQPSDPEQGDRKQCLGCQIQGLTPEPSDARENFLQFLDREVNRTTHGLPSASSTPRFSRPVSGCLQGRVVTSQAVACCGPWHASGSRPDGGSFGSARTPASLALRHRRGDPPL